MKKYIYVILFLFNISLFAQDFIINGKLIVPFNENFNKAFVLESLIATNDNAYSIGAFFGVADLDFNSYGYEWAASYEETSTKAIYGFITYIYPLNQSNFEFFRPIYLSFTWAKIGNRGIIQGGGYMFSGPGYAYPQSKNEKIWIISSGYKIPFKKINFLLGFGYQHREYDLMYSEYYDDYTSYYRSIHQIEKFFQVDIGLQFVF